MGRSIVLPERFLMKIRAHMLPSKGLPTLSQVSRLLQVFTLMSVAGFVHADSTHPALDESDVIRGVVAPVAKAALATDVVARIAEMPFRDGMPFSKGDVLIAFDCARLDAELAAATASKNAAWQAYDNNVELAAHDAVGENEVIMSRAEFSRASAEHQARVATMKGCVLKAPYDGRVVKTHVNAHEIPSGGGTLIEIIDDSDLELELIVPSSWLSWLREGSHFEFHVDETQTNYEATVMQIGAIVDAVSQTVMISGRFQQRPERILVGMSGTAKFTEKYSLKDIKDKVLVGAVNE